MKNFCKIIFIFFVLSLYAEAQTVTWQKWYDYNNYDSEASDAIQTIDGGYLILTNNFATPSNSVLLIKVNYLGNIEWQKLIDNTLIGFGLSCFSISQASDSGYVASGYGTNAVLFKINVNGDLLWVKTYPRLGLETRFWNHKITRDGGIIAVGDLNPPYEGRVVKTDKHGNVLWDSTYNYNLILSKIIQSSFDQSYYFTVTTRITKIDSIGRLIWSKPYDYIGGDILQTQSGDIYTATGNNAFYLNKVDTSGHLIWQKSYLSPDAVCSGLCLSKDGTLLLTGFQTQASVFEIIALKTDLNGKEIFAKTITSFNGNYFALPRNVNSTIDSGFIFAGITDFPNTAIMRNNAFATKTDYACNAPLFVSINENFTAISDVFELKQNYPNPFNSLSAIKYELYNPGFVTLQLYDNNGRMISNLVDQYQSIGNYKIFLDAENLRLSSGIYFTRIIVKPLLNSKQIFTGVKKLIYLK